MNSQEWYNLAKSRKQMHSKFPLFLGYEIQAKGGKPAQQTAREMVCII